MNESEDELHDGSRQQDVPTKTVEIEKPSPKFFPTPKQPQSRLVRKIRRLCFLY